MLSPLALTVTEFPKQTLGELTVKVGLGVESTVIVGVTILVHAPKVPKTVYVVVVVGVAVT